MLDNKVIYALSLSLYAFYGEENYWAGVTFLGLENGICNNQHILWLIKTYLFRTD